MIAQDDAVLDLDLPLLRLIYEGALEPQLWVEFLREFRRRLHCTHANVAFYRSGMSPDSVVDADYDLEATSLEYTNKYSSLDPIPYLALTPGRVYSKDELWEVDHVFYREYLQPRGIAELALMPVAEPGGMRAWLTFARPAGAFSASEYAAIRALVPHFSSALRIFSTLKTAEVERDIYKEAVESSAIGTILLDAQRTVMRIDAAAARILERNAALSIHGGRMRAQSRGIDAELQEILLAATSTSGGESLYSRALRLGDDGQLNVLVRSIGSSSVLPHDKAAVAVVYVSDPRFASTATVQRLIDLFKLSGAEASLALQLARGRTLSEAAVALNLSEQTARTYSKQVFSKTGTHRQAELVRLILTSVAHLAPDRAHSP